MVDIQIYLQRIGFQLLKLMINVVRHCLMMLRVEINIGRSTLKGIVLHYLVLLLTTILVMED